MKLNVYAIYDLKMQAFSQPYFTHTNGTALRSFADHVNEKGTAANSHPEDFALFHIGTYDDQAGEIAGVKHTRLGSAEEYKTKEPK